MGVGIGKGFNSGFVSLTQIKVLAREFLEDKSINVDYVNCVLIYKMKNGRGFLKIVSFVYQLKEGELLFLNQKGLQRLAKGFYDLNPSKAVTITGLEELYKEVNKRVIFIETQRPKEEQIEDLYNKVQSFRSFYRRLSDLPQTFTVNYTDYDLTPEEIPLAKVAVMGLFNGLAVENGLELMVKEVQPDIFVSYGFKYYDLQMVNAYDVYEMALNKFLNGKKLAKDEYNVAYKTLINMYRYPNKRGFYEVVATDDYKYYGLGVEFMERLTSDYKRIPLKGLETWYSRAKKVRGSKEAIQELAKGSRKYNGK